MSTSLKIESRLNCFRCVTRNAEAKCQNVYIFVYRWKYDQWNVRINYELPVFFNRIFEISKVLLYFNQVCHCFIFRYFFFFVRKLNWMCTTVVLSWFFFSLPCTIYPYGTKHLHHHKRNTNRSAICSGFDYEKPSFSHFTSLKPRRKLKPDVTIHNSRAVRVEWIIQKYSTYPNIFETTRTLQYRPLT